MISTGLQISKTKARGGGRRLALAACLLPATLWANAAGPVSAAASQPKAVCAWRVTAAPSPGVGAAALRGVDALSRGNIWAVGSKDAQGATLAEHWTGKRWTVVPTRNRSGFTQLEDVTIVSRNNVWAVGWYVPSGGSHPKTLVEHWNGSRWRAVPSPNPLKGSNLLFGVDASSGKNVWAVGGDNLDPSVGSRQITLQWDGTRWRARAGLSIRSGLQDVAAIGPRNVVAVGHTGSLGSTRPIIQRYNGSHWKSLAPGTSSSGAHLQAVSAPSATAEWAVGQRSGNAALKTLTLRNAGAGWREVAGANSSLRSVNVLHGVAALSARQAWAVGYHENRSFVSRTMVQHFAHGHWSIVPSPNPSRNAAELLDVVSVRGDLWAVGYSTNASLTSRVLVESRRC